MSRRALVRAGILLAFILVMVLIPHTTTQAIPPEINKSFSPTIIDPGGVSTLRIELFNANSSYDLTGAAFTDNMPANMLVANPPNSTNTCGATVSANAGDTFSRSRTAQFRAKWAVCPVVV